MRFANLQFKSKSINNIGDNMQLIAIDYIYESMGINKDEIVYIEKEDLKNYSGDYVILPISMPMVDYSSNGMEGRFSDRIIPVFLGLTLAKNSLNNVEVSYYKRFEPIGCRDEKTLLLLRSYGIFSYLHGCITATLPKRVINKTEQKQIYLVDCDPHFEKYIPSSITSRATILTHS